jgi:hypothetical protein
LLLPYQLLVSFYMHLISGTLLILAEIMSRVYVEEELAIAESPVKISQYLWTTSYYKRQIIQAMCCLSVSACTAWCIGFKNPVMKCLPCIYILPIAVRMADYPVDLLPLALRLSSLAMLATIAFYFIYLTPTIFRYGQSTYYCYWIFFFFSYMINYGYIF